MMCKIDAHEYQTVKEFLADVKLMSSNALEYNPSTYNEERLIRHRACLVAGKCILFNPYWKINLDVAHEFVDNELDPNFETICEQVKIARALRGSQK